MWNPRTLLNNSCFCCFRVFTTESATASRFFAMMRKRACLTAGFDFVAGLADLLCQSTCTALRSREEEPSSVAIHFNRFPLLAAKPSTRASLALGRNFAQRSIWTYIFLILRARPCPPTTFFAFFFRPARRAFHSSAMGNELVAFPFSSPRAEIYARLSTIRYAYAFKRKTDIFLVVVGRFKLWSWGFKNFAYTNTFYMTL